MVDFQDPNLNLVSFGKLPAFRISQPLLRNRCHVNLALESIVNCDGSKFEEANVNRTPGKVLHQRPNSFKYVV